MMRLSILFLLFFLISGQLTVLSQDFLSPKREFRGVWVATVYNIDWPKSGLDEDSVQMADFEKMMDFYQALNFNAVIAQVRAAGDVFYPSEYEPWSRYLKYTEGKAPGYDPLKFMIDASHRRGLEFHAWFNPYRVSMTLDSSRFHQKHPFHQHRDWIITYGNRFCFNPGLPEVRRYITEIVMEVVRGYDVDGIHFDDYFYPYKIKDEFFNDTLTFRQYGQGFETIEDWRRANVDSLVKMISDSIHAVKPYVKFGISPFGVWRNQDVDPKGSATKAGQTCYDDLYADPLVWSKNKWVDYLIPQLYWSIGFTPASHSTLVEWWNKNVTDVPVYVGLGAYKVDNNADPAWGYPDQLLKQITLHRLFDKIQGGTFFSAKSLMANPLKLANLLKEGPYKNPALLPLDVNDRNYETPQALKTLRIRKKRKKTRVFWEIQPEDAQNLRKFLIYRVPKGIPPYVESGAYLWKVVPYQKGIRQYSSTDTTLKASKKYTYYVSAVNRFHRESTAATTKK